MGATICFVHTLLIALARCIVHTLLLALARSLLGYYIRYRVSNIRNINTHHHESYEMLRNTESIVTICDAVASV